MDPLAILVLTFVGVIAGNVIVSSILRWIGTIATVLKEQSEQRWRAAVATSLLSSGPWMVIIVAMFMYYEHDQPWARWIGAGIGLWAMFVGAIAIRVQRAAARRGISRGNGNAA